MAKCARLTAADACVLVDHSAPTAGSVHAATGCMELDVKRAHVEKEPNQVCTLIIHVRTAGFTYVAAILAAVNC